MIQKYDIVLQSDRFKGQTQKMRIEIDGLSFYHLTIRIGFKGQTQKMRIEILPENFECHASAFVSKVKLRK